MFCQKCEYYSLYKISDEQNNKNLKYRQPNYCTSWLCNDKQCPFDKMLYKKKSNISGPHPQVYGIGVHALYTNKWSTFNDFFEEHVLYSKSFPDFCVPDIEKLMEDLLKLVFLGLIKVKYNKKYTKGT